MRLVASLSVLLASACGGVGTSAPGPVAPVHVAAPAEPVVTAPPAVAVAPGMDLDQMHEIILGVGTEVQRTQSVWEFLYHSVPLAIVTDERADRMRIVSPVARIVDLTPAHLDAILHANFHSALDARYAASGDVLYSVFIHPLSTLHPDDLESAIRQTATLVRTFGSSYSSGDLVFGAP